MSLLHGFECLRCGFVCETSRDAMLHSDLYCTNWEE